ncbi:MAG: radical SAM protein [Phycisphaerales bacterium]|nr:radical SAM protein [Phycisphaerales bacterium]
MKTVALEIDNQLLPEWYHVTALSNFVKGYDKYQGRYSKAHISQSTFPDQFFLLREEEIPIGVSKASRLVDKLGLDGDRLIVLKTRMPENQLRNDHASGVAQYVPQDFIDLDSVYFIDNEQSLDVLKLIPARIEGVVAQSFEVIDRTLLPWDQLTPRTISVLPIAMACQASCKFCFSKASVSSGFEGRISDWGRIVSVLETAKEAGAERAVITGGGEPTLLKGDQMLKLVGECASHFSKVVLITNAHLLGEMDTEKRLAALLCLDQAGLSVLAISHHHYDAAQNAEIMGLDTKTEKVVKTFRDHEEAFRNISLRFVCVLQDEGVSSVPDIEHYLSWSAGQGVAQVTFKELYVSTSNESAFSDLAANDYSAKHQVSLSVVYDFAAKHSWEKVSELPWGAPIFKGEWDGRCMQIAAYTEPSVYWERANGVARSWNLMSDGTALASLEDPMSQVAPR